MSRAYRTSPGNSARRIDPQRIRRAGVDKEELSVEYPLIYRNGKIALDIADESRDMLTVNPSGLAVDATQMGTTIVQPPGSLVTGAWVKIQLTAGDPIRWDNLNFEVSPGNDVRVFTPPLQSYDPAGDVSIDTGADTITLQPGIWRVLVALYFHTRDSVDIDSHIEYILTPPGTSGTVLARGPAPIYSFNASGQVVRQGSMTDEHLLVDETTPITFVLRLAETQVPQPNRDTLFVTGSSIVVHRLQ